MTHSHHHHSDHSHHPPKKKVPWIWIVAVVLMLAGMAFYILSMDESLQPAMETPPAAVEAGP